MSPAFLRLPRGRPELRAGAGVGAAEVGARGGSARPRRAPLADWAGGGRSAGRWQVWLGGRRGGGEGGRTRSARGTEEFRQSAS